MRKITIEIPDNVFSDNKEIIDTIGHQRFEKFLTDKIQAELTLIKNDKALMNLIKNYASVKNIKPLTLQEREKVAEEHTEEKAKHVLEEFGLS